MSYLCRERVSTAHCFFDYVTNYVTPNDACILDVAKLFVNNLSFTKKQSASPDLTDAIVYVLYFSETSTSSFFIPSMASCGAAIWILLPKPKTQA